MTIAHVSNGSAGVGTTGIAALAYPAATTAGNLLVMYVANKYPNNGPSTPTGWVAPANNQWSGGNGASGVDAGNVYVTWFTRIADGTEGGGTIALTVTSGNSVTARISQYSKDTAGAVWDIACTGGSFDTPGTAWSVTGATNPDIAGGDMVLVASALNTDLYTNSLQTLAATGLVVGTLTERNDSVTANGDDCGLNMCQFVITSGTASAAPVYTATVSGTNGASAPAGASAFLRLRELASVTSTSSGTAAGTSAATGVGRSTARSSGTAGGSSTAAGVGTTTGVEPHTPIVLGHVLLASGLLRRGLFSGGIL